MVLTVIALTLLAFTLVVPAPWALSRAQWVVREPRAALVLWQALGLAAGLAVLGAAFALGVAPLGRTLPEAMSTWWSTVSGGDLRGGLGVGHLVLLVVACALFAWLVGMTMLSAWRIWRSRRRHRELVDLVSAPLSPTAIRPTRPRPIARVIDHADAVAYCLPGSAARVVLSTGALDLLDADELDAVLAHEHAHLAERHDLVVLPFTAWSAAVPWLGGPRRAHIAVERLVEMVADDRACVGRDRYVLATALARVGAAGTPAGALGAGDHALLARVRRLLDPPGRCPMARRIAYLGAFALLVLPTFLLVGPALV